MLHQPKPRPCFLLCQRCEWWKTKGKRTQTGEPREREREKCDLWKRFLFCRNSQSTSSFASKACSRKIIHHSVCVNQMWTIDRFQLKWLNNCTLWWIPDTVMISMAYQSVCGPYQLQKGQWDWETRKIYIVNWVYFHGFIVQNYSYSF